MSGAPSLDPLPRIREAIDDRLDRVFKFLKQGDGIFPLTEAWMTKGYAEGRIRLAIKLESGRSGREYHLFLERIPLGGGEHCRVGGGVKVNGDVPQDRAWLKQPAMNVEVAESVEAPEKSIPSLVWIQPADRQLVGGGELLYFSMNSWKFKFLGVPSEGEIDALCIRMPVVDSQVAGEKVQGGTKIVQGIAGKFGEIFGDISIETDLDRFMQTVVVHITDRRIWLACHKLPNLGVEVRDVLMSTLDFPLGAGGKERVASLGAAEGIRCHG